MFISFSPSRSSFNIDSSRSLPKLHASHTLHTHSNSSVPSAGNHLSAEVTEHLMHDRLAKHLRYFLRCTLHISLAVGLIDVCIPLWTKYSPHHSTDFITMPQWMVPTLVPLCMDSWCSLCSTKYNASDYVIS